MDDSASNSYKFLSEIVANESELDIRSYTQKIKEELTKLEDQCLSDYMAVTNNVATLYEELEKSERVLDKIDTVVDNFQHTLTDISEEVSKLQQASEAHNISLKNRRNLEETIHEYLECILLPEELIDELCNREIDADQRAYLANLDRFNKMLTKSRTAEVADSQALEEVMPEMEKLKFKVISRARNYLISKLNNLRKPKSNFQIYQESVLLKFKPMVSFLREHSMDTYIELTNIYAEVMDQVYYSHLRQYFTDTAKFIKKVSKGTDLLFSEKQGLQKSDSSSAVMS